MLSSSIADGDSHDDVNGGGSGGSSGRVIMRAGAVRGSSEGDSEYWHGGMLYQHEVKIAYEM